MYTQEGAPEPTVPFLEYGVAFTVLVYVFETVLDFRQRAKFSEQNVPKKLKNALQEIDPKLLEETESKFEASQSYSKDKSSFSLLKRVFDESLALVLLIRFGYMPWLWDQTAQYVPMLLSGSPATEHVIVHSLVFVVGVHLMDTALGMPFDLYHHFVVEERHGMNKMSLSTWVTDQCKSTALGGLIGLPVLATLLWLIEWAGERWYMFVWAFILLFSFAMMAIFPTFIQPLFNEFVPLKDSGDTDEVKAKRGILQQKIEDLAGRVSYPLKKIFVVDGSKRSSHSNAYMFGFGSNKRIVLYDTLLDQAGDAEVCAILAHELGHWAKGHTVQGFVVTQLYLGAMFYGFSLCQQNEAMFSSFGFREQPAFIGILLFGQTLWAPAAKIIGLLLTANTRRNEFQADEFSTSMGYAIPLQSGLVKIHTENLSNLTPDWLYSQYHFSHPPLVERLDWITTCAKEKKV